MRHSYTSLMHTTLYLEVSWSLLRGSGSGCSEVLPSIRKTSSYQAKGNQLSIINGSDLHYSVVKYIRTYHPTLIIPGLGEHRRKKELRADAYYMVYSGSTPDIVVPLISQEYSGFAIELKTPTLKASLARTKTRC